MLLVYFFLDGSRACIFPFFFPNDLDTPGPFAVRYSQQKARQLLPFCLLCKPATSHLSFLVSASFLLFFLPLALPFWFNASTSSSRRPWSTLPRRRRQGSSFSALIVFSRREKNKKTKRKRKGTEQGRHLPSSPALVSAQTPLPRLLLVSCRPLPVAELSLLPGIFHLYAHPPLALPTRPVPVALCSSSCLRSTAALLWSVSARCQPLASSTVALTLLLRLSPRSRPCLSPS